MIWRVSKYEKQRVAMLAIIILPCDKAHAAAALTDTVASNRFERMTFALKMQLCRSALAKKHFWLVV